MRYRTFTAWARPHADAVPRSLTQGLQAADGSRLSKRTVVNVTEPR